MKIIKEIFVINKIGGKMEKKRIIDLFSNCIFDGELYSEVVDEKIFAHLPDDFKYDWKEGASKLVIIPYDADYVIKIPYNGQYRRSTKMFEQFLSANGTDNYFWDYCLTETLVWKLAKIEHIHKAFAKERMIGMINGHPIYIQQRVEIFSDLDECYADDEIKREKTKDYCEKKGLVTFYEEVLNWQADALEYYGPKQFDKIMSFIKRNSIGDFHNSNLGYFGTKPVFVDYSDFNE